VEANCGLRPTSPIHAAFHALCLYTGMRPGELARAEWKNLDLKRRVLAITDTKKAPVVEVRTKKTPRIFSGARCLLAIASARCRLAAPEKPQGRLG
jgi:integrase